ncbi:hypothetical protein RclHR1_25870003 [Rhizophagus clarus]|nr:hypothetical protein RclHR1_25870003 [Rhizophagus clarus]
MRVIRWSLSSSAVMRAHASAISCCKAFSKDKISLASRWNKKGGWSHNKEREEVRNTEENETERSYLSLDLERVQ